MACQVTREFGLTVDELLQKLSARITPISVPHPTRVAIDGIDAAGKTTLANALAGRMRRDGHEIIRASIDGFHRPLAERYARGALSPVGYYEDSFDYERLVHLLLAPLSKNDPGRYQRQAFDYLSDAPAPAMPESCGPRAILLFEGVFLFRPEINSWWDYRIFVDVSFEAALQRAIARDGPRMGGERSTENKYRQRYFPGQRLYFDLAKPKNLAHVIVHNDDPSEPNLTELRRA
jgi:uridine kinase